MTSKIISVSGFKGGVGKSTIATNMAAGCARAGLRTILVETDGQGNASQSMRIKPHNSFYDLMHGAALGRVVDEVPIEFHGIGELYLISAFNLQQQVESDPETPMQIIQRFRELRDLVDVIIVDTSPGNTEVHAGLFYAADYLILPTLCDFLSIRSLATTLAHRTSAVMAADGTAYRVAEVLGIVPNRFQAREDVQQANLNVLHRDYDAQFRVFGVVRDLTAWRQASQLRQSIYAYEHPTNKRAARVAANELDPVLAAVLAVTGHEMAVTQ